MPKTEQTIALEREIWAGTHKQGVYGCFEVTIGWFGEQRVDYLTYDTKGIWRCYEIKVSKADFHSKAHITLIGHYNYFVLPRDMYEQVKNEIPAHIGAYVGGDCVKKAKKQDLAADEQVLKNSMIRSLCREAEKVIKSENPNVIDSLTRQINYYKRRARDFESKYWDLMRLGQEKSGRGREDETD